MDSTSTSAVIQDCREALDGEDDIIGMQPHIPPVPSANTTEARQPLIPPVPSADFTGAMQPHIPPLPSANATDARQDMNVELSLKFADTKTRKRGRPRGCDKTAIGLPRKRAKKMGNQEGSNRGNLAGKPCSFMEKTSQEKTSFILGLLFGDKEKDIYTKTDLPTFGNLRNELGDSKIDVKLIEDRLTVEAKDKLNEMLNRLMPQLEMRWKCGMCNRPLSEHRFSTCCDSCLMWFHDKCLGFQTPIKVKLWFCKECKKIKHL